MKEQAWKGVVTTLVMLVGALVVGVAGGILLAQLW